MSFTDDNTIGDNLADGANVQKSRTCPVCDEAVPPDAQVCPSCSTDLSLFSADDSGGDLTDPEELKRSLLSAENGHVAELLHAAEDNLPPLPPKPSAAESGESAECPACHKSIAMEAVKCPHCGVEFVIEEVFECPMCGTLVDIHVNKCPSCNAEFVDEAEPAASQPPVQHAAAPKPPQPEPKLEPASFVDRLRQMKDEGPSKPAESAQPKKELSFAERMKLMKGDKPAEVAPAQPAPTTPARPPSQAASKPQAQPQKVPPQATQAAAQPKKEASISDRVKSLKDGAVTQAKPAQPVPTQKPTQPQVPTPEASVKEGYKELPVYIGEVKKLLIIANNLYIDVSTSKALINRAVSAGKTRDLENAVKLVKEGKTGLEKDIRIAMLSKLRTLETALSLERKSGKDTSPQERAISESRKSIDVADFQSAIDTMKRLENHLLSTSTANLSQVELESVSCAMADADALHLNVGEAKALYNAAVQANAQKDSQKLAQYSKQATEVLNKVLPPYISAEMRKAKVTLREIKMMNVDISSPVNLLKEANDHVLSGNYCAALGSIKKFKDFVDRAQQQG